MAAITDTGNRLEHTHCRCRHYLKLRQQGSESESKHGPQGLNGPLSGRVVHTVRRNTYLAPVHWWVIMAGKWMAGVADTPSKSSPPSVDSWTPVSVPGRPHALVDRLEGGDTLVYRTSFVDPRSSATERTHLAFRGAPGLEAVWINGERREVERTPYYVETVIEFDPEPENELFVCFDAGYVPPGIFSTDMVSRLWSLPGLWWGVDIRISPATFLETVAVRPRVIEERAAIDVELTVDVGDVSALDDAVTLSLRPDGFRGGGTMSRVPVAGEVGEKVHASTTLEVRDPSLWWPREHGEQHQYTIRAKLGDDAVERTVGLRTVERTEDAFLVNGQSVRGRGLERRPSADPAADVERALEANATLLRVRGHAPHPDLYEACDEAGLLVWQDVPGLTPDTAKPARVQELLERYCVHPSLVALGLLDEPVDPFASALGPGPLARLTYRWRSWRAAIDDGIADPLVDVVPETHATIPTTGPPGTDATATTLFPGWRYLRIADIEPLLENTPALGQFVAAFGAESVLDDERDPRTIAGVDAAALERRTTGSEDSQQYQTHVLQTIASVLRCHDSAWFVASTLRDGAPGGGPGILTLEGTPKPAFEPLAQAYEPVQAVLGGVPAPGSTVPIVLCNDRPTLLEATVSWETGNQSGAETVAVNAMGRTQVETLEIPPDAREVHLEVTLPERTVGHTYGLY